MKKLLSLLILCLMGQALTIQCNMIPPEDSIIGSEMLRTSLLPNESETIKISKYFSLGHYSMKKYLLIDVITTNQNINECYKSQILYDTHSFNFTRPFIFFYIGHINSTDYGFLFPNLILHYGPSIQHNFSVSAIDSNLHFTIYNDESFTSTYEIILFLKQSHKASYYPPTRRLPDWAAVIIGISIYLGLLGAYYGIKKIILIYHNLPSDVAKALNKGQLIYERNSSD